MDACKISFRLHGNEQEMLTFSYRCENTCITIFVIVLLWLLLFVLLLLLAEISVHTYVHDYAYKCIFTAWQFPLKLRGCHMNSIHIHIYLHPYIWTCNIQKQVYLKIIRKIVLHKEILKYRILWVAEITWFELNSENINFLRAKSNCRKVKSNITDELLQVAKLLG